MRDLSTNRRSFITRGIALGAILAIVAGVLGWTTLRDMRSDRVLTERLMTSYARSIAAVIGEGESHGRRAYQGWEDELERRLRDNARWIARLDSIAPLTSDQLNALIGPRSPHMVHLYDAQGRLLACSRVPAGCQACRFRQENMDSLLTGEMRTMRHGFRQRHFRAGNRFAVGIRRAHGGAVVVSVDANPLRGMLRRIEPAHLIRSLGTLPGIRYAAIEIGDSIIASSPEDLALPPAPPDAAQAIPLADSLASFRELQTATGEVFEVLSSLRMPGDHTARLRVGLDASLLDEARESLKRRAWVRLLIFLLTTVLAGLLALAWQRHRMMSREIQHVRAELEAREREAIRTEKVAAMGALASGVAHQIRNPLNTIHMVAQQLERNPVLDAEQQKQVSHVRSESRRIEGIVQQFLEFARPRPPRWESCDVAAVASETAAAMQASFQAANVTLETDVQPAPSQADREYVVCIIENLLRNAREVAPAGTRVQLIVRRTGEEIEIIVADQGPGVPLAERERIFDHYYTTKPSGTGIGLSEVARMAAAMGGGVRVEDAEEGGACFRVHFRRAR